MKNYLSKFKILFFTLFILQSSLTTKVFSMKREMPGQDKIAPIVYSPKYDIPLKNKYIFLGTEIKLHDFDIQKYKNIAQILHSKLYLEYSKPETITDKDILMVHTNDYIKSLNNPKNISNISEIDIFKYIPNFLIQTLFLDKIKQSCGGTYAACKLALENKKWAINLGGGYHHAESDNSSGFCFFNDIAIAIKKLEQELNKSIKILIIDLDAHLGNGNNIIFKDSKNVFIFDIHNKKIFPENKQDYYFEKDFIYPVNGNKINDKKYLKILNKNLQNIINKINPELMIYNAGTDIYEKDPLGNMNITKDGIIKRDEIVFNTAKINKIPITMVLSGGYHEDSATIISESIINLFNKKIIDLN